MRTCFICQAPTSEKLTLFDAVCMAGVGHFPGFPAHAAGFAVYCRGGRELTEALGDKRRGGNLLSLFFWSPAAGPASQREAEQADLDGSDLACMPCASGLFCSGQRAACSANSPGRRAGNRRQRGRQPPLCTRRSKKPVRLKTLQALTTPAAVQPQQTRRSPGAAKRPSRSSGSQRA